MTSVEARVAEIFDYYEKEGNGDYIGSEVSKLFHSLQCAMLAESEGQSVPVILGAFFHDLGHMIGDRHHNSKMIDPGSNTYIGIKNHAILGAEFLQTRGFPAEVTDIVKYHVQAKRYLCATQPDYYESLDWASKRTLEHQGGPMNATQVDSFRRLPNLDLILKARNWDEQAKDPKWVVLRPLSHYRDMACSYLNSLQQ